NMEEGRSNQDLANSLVEKKIANKSRAKLIARTETHGCANNGIFEMMNSTKMTLEKEWLTAGDARVRSRSFDHSGADAERVHMDANFEKTGEPLMYPGDPFGSAGNVCRCRCGTLYHEVRRAA
ncbi:MAG: hypothetical protein GY757_09125, partial [bacterium]|nr:hypothetical protein [bacterium]